MRSFAFATGILAAAASTAAGASLLSKCPLIETTSAAELAQHIICPDASSIQTCLTSTLPHASKVDALIPCLRVNGCEGTESLVTLCSGKGAELRRRQGFADIFGSDETDTADATEEPTAKATDKVTKTEENNDKTTAKETKETKAATTTADTESETTATTAAVTTDDSTTAAPTTSAPTATPTTLQSTASPESATRYTSFAPDPTALTCLATSMISTSFCGILTQDGSRTTLPCVPTTTPSTYCAPGLLCQTQEAGHTTCMKRDAGLTTSGLIVAIVFGAALASCIAALIFFVCRTKRARKQQERMLQAQMVRDMHSSNARDIEAMDGGAFAAGMGAAAGRGRRDPSASEASLPLMAQQGPAGGLDPGYSGHREPRTLQKQHPASSRGVSPVEDGDDIGYRRRG